MTALNQDHISKWKKKKKDTSKITPIFLDAVQLVKKHTENPQTLQIFKIIPAFGRLE